MQTISVNIMESVFNIYYKHMLCDFRHNKTY